MPKKLVGTSYAARVLEVSEVRVRQLVEKGKLKVNRKTFDGRRFYDPADIEQLRRSRERNRALRQKTKEVSAYDEPHADTEK